MAAAPAPVAAPPVQVPAAPPAAPMDFQPPVAQPIAAAEKLPSSGVADLDVATVRDPHAAFRRRSPKPLLAAVAGLAVVMGGLIYLSSGDEEKVAKKPTQTEKPVIGVSLAPYRSDAHETMPKAADAGTEQPQRAEPPPSSERAAPDVGSDKDFAERFKAASGRE